MVKYSICITHYNNFLTVKKSLDSILDQIDTNFEVIVVDNFSNDGSLRVLREYADLGKIKLIQKKCSRGKGRQTALEHASGTYVIANMDMDDTYKPKLRSLLQIYHQISEGKVLMVVSSFAFALRSGWLPNITLGPKRLIQELGGWRDLQWWEDWELWARAAKAGKFCHIQFDIHDEVNLHAEREGTLKKIRRRYGRYRDLLRVGRNVFTKKERKSLLQRLVFLLARVTVPLYESYKDDFYSTFDPCSEAYDATELRAEVHLN